MTEEKRKYIYGFDDQRDVFLLYRDREGKKKIDRIKDFEWHFFILSKDYVSKTNDLFETYRKVGVLSKVKKSEDGKYLKIYCNRFSSNFNLFITDLKALGVKCLEMDLTLSKRYMIDNQIKLEEKFKIGYFDIETDDFSGKITIGKEQILSWAIVGQDGNVDYFSSKDERELLLKFLKTMDKYDMIVGWNSSGFDIPYIKARLAKLDNLDWKVEGHSVWRRTMQIDLMMRLVKLFAPIMSILGLSGFSLNEVSRVFLEKEKIMRDKSIRYLFENELEKLKEYNVGDCILVKEINEKMQTLDLMIKECAWTGSFLDRFFVGEILDNYILREANKKNFHLGSRPNRAEEEENRKNQVTGGYVMEPKIGYYENVRVFDFKSLYPTIIIGYNLGEDTLVKEISDLAKKNYLTFLDRRKIENISLKEWMSFLSEQKKGLDPKDECYQSAINQFFRKGSHSIIADLVENLLNQRIDLKKKMDSLKEGTSAFANARAAQEVVKELANSMYGITADASSRYYNPLIAESITITGQFFNRYAAKVFEEVGKETLYADTDSIFVSIENDAETEMIHGLVNKNLNLEIQDFFKIENKENLISLEYEKKYRKFILLDKKRYIGQLVWSNGKETDFIHSRGTENVRKDTIGFTRRKLVELVELIFRDSSLDQVKSFIYGLRKTIYEENLEISDITIVKKLSKPLSDYKTLPVHARLAQGLLDDERILDVRKSKFSWGERVHYIITDCKRKDGAVLLENYSGKWDRPYYWRIQVLAPLERILRTVWPQERWMIFGEEYYQKGLFT